MKRLLVFYICLLIFLNVYSYGFVDPHLTVSTNALYLKFHQPLFELVFFKRLFSTVIFITLIFLSFLFYFSYLRLTVKNKIFLHRLKRVIGVTVGLAIFAYPAFSYDIFNYVLTAKVTYWYHENPYIVMPIEFLGDPSLAFTRAANKIALYGPMWILLSAIPYVLSFGNIILSIFSFKALAAVFYLATTWMIWKISQDKLSVALFALNPLVIIETLVSGHNDIVMMFFALLSFYLLKKEKIFVAFLALLTSILIKYATVVLIPVFFYAWYRTWRKREIKWNTIYIAATVLMFAALLTAPLREEIYSWYVIWILSFAVLVPKDRFLLSFALALSFGVLLRYIPVLYTGSYSGTTPVVKELVTFVPLGVVCVFWLCKRFFWQKFSP